MTTKFSKLLCDNRVTSMKRRDFVISSAATAAAFNFAPIFARADTQTMTTVDMDRAAVVIGVDKVGGGLTKLDAAATDARLIAAWLRDEKYQVDLFDDGKPEYKFVRGEDIFDAIRKIVDKGTFKQLVVYFSGHGFIKNGSEMWLLSGAPDNPNQAISVRECLERGGKCGIKNVALISDACRSRLASMPDPFADVEGMIIFPQRAIGDAPVDVFYAALPGQPALELEVAESAKNFQGIFTTCFLQAFRAPSETMVLELPDHQRVVPNRKLDDYLRSEVQKAVKEKNLTVKQWPVAHVYSRDNVYIGRVAPGATVALATPIAEVTVSDVAQDALQRAGVDVIKRSTFLNEQDVNTINISAYLTGFDRAQSEIVRASSTEKSFDAETGFSIGGAGVTDAAALPRGERVEILQRGDGDHAGLVRVNTVRSALSVAIQFNTGSGVILPALKGYIGHVVVDDVGCNNVSYIPSQNNPLWNLYPNEKERLEKLHAAVATAARFGTFRIEGNPETRAQRSENLADQIHVGALSDPTLGIYAAYAYADANLIGRIQQLEIRLHDQLNTELFDVALLANRFPETALITDMDPIDREDVVPICPMLTQGWSLLRVKGVELPEFVAPARDRLLQSLWTTFAPQDTVTILAAFRSGQLARDGFRI